MNKFVLSTFVLTTLVIFMAQVSLASVNYLTEVKTQTSTKKYSASSNPIFLEICDEVSNDCCQFSLGNQKWRRLGNLDVHENPWNQCIDFNISKPKSVSLRIEGTDGWLGEYLMFSLKNGDTYNCPITQWLDNSETMGLDCFINHVTEFKVKTQDAGCFEVPENGEYWVETPAGGDFLAELLPTEHFPVYPFPHRKILLWTFQGRNFAYRGFLRQKFTY